MGRFQLGSRRDDRQCADLSQLLSRFATVEAAQRMALVVEEASVVWPWQGMALVVGLRAAWQWPSPVNNEAAWC